MQVGPCEWCLPYCVHHQWPEWLAWYAHTFLWMNICRWWQGSNLPCLHLSSPGCQMMTWYVVCSDEMMVKCMWHDALSTMKWVQLRACHVCQWVGVDSGQYRDAGWSVHHDHVQMRDYSLGKGSSTEKGHWAAECITWHTCLTVSCDMASRIWAVGRSWMELGQIHPKLPGWVIWTDVMSVERRWDWLEPLNLIIFEPCRQQFWVFVGDMISITMSLSFCFQGQMMKPKM